MMLHKAHKTIADYNMLEKGDNVLVGVSGGPDSMALLYCLEALKKEFSLKLYVVHLNHMIRKRDAERDALFVKKLAEKLGLPAEMESQDVPRLARENKISLEEAGRAARYDFYLRAAKKFKANKIALGHTEDDQAETVLMRLIRGSGLLGLSGIPPTRESDGITIIRPFIEISKSEILKFLSERRILFRQDATNFKPIYLRNRIRHRLIPFLEKEFNPNITMALREIGKNLRIDYDYLLKVARRKFKKYAKQKRLLCPLRGGSAPLRSRPACGGTPRNDGEVQLDLKFLREDTAIQRMIVREAIKKAKGNLDAVSYSHWENLNELLADKKKKRWSLTLPDNIWVKRLGNNLIFQRGAPEKQTNLEEVLYRLEVPGTVKIPEINKAIEAGFVKDIPDFREKKSKAVEYFDYVKLNAPLFIRFRRPKDRIRPFGMNRYKRLKQLFIDEKVAVEDRNRVPLVISGRRIIWVCGVKRAEEARVTAKTSRVARIRVG